MNTYAPAYHFTNKQEGLVGEPTAPIAIEPISFVEGKAKIEQLYERRDICRSGNSLMVGYDEAHQPQAIELGNASFIAVAGQPRVGKTTTVKFLLAQAAMMGWHIVLCDKHGKQEQGLLKLCYPLSGSFIRQAIEPDEIVEAILLVDKIGRRRLAGDADNKPVLLVIDEFTSLVLRGELPDDVLARLCAMVVEYSKVWVHGLIIGHDWTGKLLGSSLGTPLRRAITHRIVHRSDVQNAEFLLPNASLARQVTSLDKGQALYWGNYAPSVVAVPWIGEEDMRFAGRGLAPIPYSRRIIPQTKPQTQQLPPQSLTLDGHIKTILAASSKPLSLKEIEAKLPSYDHQSVSNALTKLTNAREITREGNRRSYVYSL